MQSDRALRRTATGLGAALGTGTLGLLATAWRYAREVLEPSRAGDPYALKVLAVDGDSVGLHATDDTLDPGVCSLEWVGGYGLLGAVVQRCPMGVRRALTDRVGVALAPGMQARIKRHAHEGNPRLAFGLAFTDLEIHGPVGAMPGWLVPSASGDGVTWAIIVHGRGSTRAAVLRVVPELHALGMTSLVITYRNDVGAAASPDGLYHLGDTEWLDLEAAVHEALTRGARRVVAFGDSMGGAIVLQFLERSPVAGAVRAIVLDSPVLDWHSVLALAAGQRRLPPLLTAVAKQIVRLRVGLHWDRFDRISRAGDLTVPVLLVHGDADETVPVSTSDAFAARRPDLVTYLRVPGAGHVEGWTVDQPAYATALRSFLAPYC